MKYKLAFQLKKTTRKSHKAYKIWWHGDFEQKWNGKWSAQTEATKVSLWFRYCWQTCMKKLRKKKKMERKCTSRFVHTHICGLLNPMSNGGKRYFITSIDDYTRKCFKYLLQEKSEALSCFKRFKALTEKEAEKYIRVLKSDRAREYCSKEFEQLPTPRNT